MDILIKDPEKYVETIIDIYNKYLQPLNYEPYFKAALDKACYKFINNNAVTQASHTSRKSAELLVRYCDKVLRNKYGSFYFNV
ncbi:unnamed protein product [Rotaria sp. Silwood2]|nr:unnamed protein product [Rotaria sp. Silwood2]CAF4742376.1 unnamed protein product [Rotaria sp. Silwood2]